VSLQSSEALSDQLVLRYPLSPDKLRRDAVSAKHYKYYLGLWLLPSKAHDMIAGAELCDIRANLGDDPGDLMAEYCRKRRDIVRSEQ
jgi:hypothetical protein